jgi:hypothetical protein
MSLKNKKRKEMDTHEIKFLTSNPKKALDFTNFGLGVENFGKEILEILSPNVEDVVLYKAKDTKLNNIVVEDTSLSVEDAPFFGTQIKFMSDEIQNNQNYHLKKALWQVSLCMRKDDYFYIATGETKGILKYPIAEKGYHFDRVFAVKKGEEYIHFEMLSEQEKLMFGPRFKALKLLTESIKNDNYENLKKIHINNVHNWCGEYQEEILEKKKLKCN